jgi:hypothetical protein
VTTKGDRDAKSFHHRVQKFSKGSDCCVCFVPFVVSILPALMPLWWPGELASRLL